MCPGLTMTGLSPRPGALPAATAALTVCAHPDDETFGLGGMLAALVDSGTAVDALCFTRGEASTLGSPRDLLALRDIRAAELAAAGVVLGLRSQELLAYPDGHLAEVLVAELAAHVVEVARRQGSELLLVFDEDGVTGHPDHRQATRAALSAAEELDLGVLAWAVREPVAAALNTELDTNFHGRCAVEIDITVPVDRERQRRAIACHRSQAAENLVLRRRLELTGPTEPLRWLRRPVGDG
jgi:LmbE family N-acetylglucosaminyl deacetylase